MKATSWDSLAKDLLYVFGVYILIQIAFAIVSSYQYSQSKERQKELRYEEQQTTWKAMRDSERVAKELFLEASHGQEVSELTFSSQPEHGQLVGKIGSRYYLLMWKRSQTGGFITYYPLQQINNNESLVSKGPSVE